MPNTNQSIESALNPEISISSLIAPRPKNAGQDIVVMAANMAGNDFIVGDIHGAHEAFDEVVKLLGPKDRLLMVGDLMDRGSDTLTVMEKTINDDRIFAVRGNHEELFLKAMNAIENSKNNNHKVTQDELNSLSSFLFNGGNWILENSAACNNANALEFAKKILKGEVQLIANDKLQRIKTYVEKLPYVRAVGLDSPKPCLVCHADMPFNDKELKKRVNEKNFSLSDSEKAYVTWARPVEDSEVTLTPNGRNENAIPVYCGHNITTQGNVGGAFREETNSRNLDFGAHSVGVSVVVNHTQNKIVLCGTPDALATLHNDTPQSKLFNQELKNLESSFNKTHVQNIQYKTKDLQELNDAYQQVLARNDKRPASIKSKKNPLDRGIAKALAIQKNKIKNRDENETTYRLYPHFESNGELIFLIDVRPEIFSDKNRNLFIDRAFSEYFYTTAKQQFSHDDVFNAAYADFQFANNESEVSLLLKKQHAIFELKYDTVTRDKPETHSLKILKAELEYKEAVYEIRVKNEKQYTGIGFWRRDSNSATYKLAAVREMVAEVNGLLDIKTTTAKAQTVSLNPAKIEDAKNQGTLSELNKQLKALTPSSTINLYRA